MKPVILDLFSCAGGAAMGYSRAGFDVVGVDIDPQPRYPFEFHQADALALLDLMLNAPDGSDDEWWHPTRFAAVHASPPCQARSDLQRQSKRFYEEFVPRVRERLLELGLPYVIENVVGDPDDPEARLVDPILLCGTMFPGLRVIRHRLFESSVELEAPSHLPAREHPLTFTHDKRKAHYGLLDQDVDTVQVTGGGNCTIANKRDAMGTPWMTGRECNEAIPPAYAECVGRQLMAHIERPLAVAAARQNRDTEGHGV